MYIFNKNIYKRSGFTLAEILITMVIIGIIATLTIPTTVNKVQKIQAVTKLKKAYSTFFGLMLKIRIFHLMSVFSADKA